MRMLHTMLRVGNLEKSIKFYTEILGMKVLRQHDFPDGKFTLAFVGYGDEKDHTVLELTYNYGVESYDMGKAYGHVAIEVDDAYATCEQVKKAGGKVEEAELAMVPKSWVETSDEHADLNIALIEWLENLDDVDAVYHNMK